MSKYQQFLELKQEPRRLAIALEEYFTDEIHREAYGQYLQRRIRGDLRTDFNGVLHYQQACQWRTQRLLHHYCGALFYVRHSSCSGGHHWAVYFGAV